MIAAVVLAALATSYAHFQSPSGNINCVLFPAETGNPAFAQCLVRKAQWVRYPRRPASCDLDFDPRTISLSRRRVSVGSCRGDIGPLCVATSDRCTTLAYGHSITLGGIRCTSTTGGVTCRYTTAPRAGFLIAREHYVLFRR